MKNFFEKIEIYFCFENKWKGIYKIFNITPAIIFIKDNQGLKPFYDEKAYNCYELWFDWLCWQGGVIINIEKK